MTPLGLTLLVAPVDAVVAAIADAMGSSNLAFGSLVVVAGMIVIVVWKALAMTPPEVAYHP